MNKTKLLYFHGLNSDSQSRKYQDIRQFFEKDFDVSCIEWKNDTDIDALLKDLDNKLQNEANLILIGDSTGGNFAYQLKELRKAKEIKTTLILLNPLLSFKHRIGTHPFPETLKPYLKIILQPQDAFILLGKNDETLDHSYLKNTDLPNTTLYWVDDSHRLPRFREFLGELERCVTNQTY